MHNIDIVLLQETWHPKEELKLYNFQKPLITERDSKGGGGTAILCRQNVKCVEMKEFNVKGLEAIWAEVMVGSFRFVVGSIYIPPGKIDDLSRFELVLKRVMRYHKKVLVGMDAMELKTCSMG